MVVEHDWRDCRPVTLSVEGDLAFTERGSELLAQVWAEMSDAEHQEFHRFCCLEERDADVVSTMEKMGAALRKLADES